MYNIGFAPILGIPIVKVKVAQSCPTLCHPVDYTVHGILQARTLEWGAFPFSRGSSQPRAEPKSPALQADSLPAEPSGRPSLHHIPSGTFGEHTCVYVHHQHGVSRPNNTGHISYRLHQLLHLGKIQLQEAGTIPK